MINDILKKELDEYLAKNYKEKAIIEPLQKQVSFKVTDENSFSTKEMIQYDTCYSIALPKDIELDESFSDMLFRIIDNKGIKDSECYKKAMVDRRLFSKIRSDKYYSPSKQTALSLAIGLELSLKETKELLKKAGYALSKSRKDDVIVEFFIKNNIYDLSLINETLLVYDQKPLTNY